MRNKNIKSIIILGLLLTNLGIKAQFAKTEQDETVKAKEWINSLSLNESTKENRLVEVVTTHLSAVKEWHNNHPVSTVPAGINPLDGKPLSELHRQIIADSAMPSNVHESLMNGLRKDLNEQQVALVLDKYTIGKVAFTMKGYQAIVPEMTAVETAEIQKLMEKAREQAVDYKSIKEISAIFEIYKTQAENYLNNHGRNWRQMYGDYTKKIKAEKEAAVKK